MSSLIFKLVKSTKDIQRVAQLAASIWREHYIPIIGAAQVEYMLTRFQSVRAIEEQIKRQRVIYYLIQCTHEAIGYIGLAQRNETGELFVSKFYIADSQRGKGYGRQALRFIETQASSWNLSKLSLTVNKNNSASIAAYKKLGFSRVKDMLSDIGSGFFMDDYLMEKPMLSTINPKDQDKR